MTPFLTKDELLFLSPGKQINRVALSSEDQVLETVSMDYPGVNDLLAYYQGADYVFTHRLNRLPLSSDQSLVAQSKPSTYQDSAVTTGAN